MDKLNIYQRIHKVMSEIEYIKKDSEVSGYMAVTHDNVTTMTRKHFMANGIVIYPEQVASNVITERDVNAKVPVKMMLWAGFYHINFVNIDNPDNRITVKIEAHAADNGDKAPGKAVSYATKTAILKVLQIETGVNDESRSYEPEKYSEVEKEEFYRIISEIDHVAAVVWSRKYNDNSEILAALFNSFEKGTKTKNKDIWRDLNKKGWDYFNEVANIVKTKGNVEGEGEDDSIVIETIGDMSAVEKKILSGLLEPSDIKYLKELNN